MAEADDTYSIQQQMFLSRDLSLNKSGMQDVTYT